MRGSWVFHAIGWVANMHAVAAAGSLFCDSALARVASAACSNFICAIPFSSCCIVSSASGMPCSDVVMSSAVTRRSFTRKCV